MPGEEPLHYRVSMKLSRGCEGKECLLVNI